MSGATGAYRAQILHFVDDPSQVGAAAWRYFEDGLLWVENGRVNSVSDAKDGLPTLPHNTPVHRYPHHLIVPGFIDTHVHYPQTQMMAAHGEQLLSWLQQYTFPTESQFADARHSREVATVFLDELLRNGTTTALVFATVHPTSVEAFFKTAQQRGLRMMAGKVLMDRNAPTALCDTAETGYQESLALIERWHNVDRLQYAITPRFAPTSTLLQLELAGQLHRAYPDTYVHTHLAESRAELEWVRTLFPAAQHYLDIYDQVGLVGRRSVFAHGIHLCDDQCQRLARAGASIAHCPLSNLFLGSGLLGVDRLRRAGVNVALGTDVGAGNSFSLLRAVEEAYKVQQLQGQTLAPMQGLYMATLAGARALDLEGVIGNFLPGNEADFTVLDLQATPLLRFRLPYCQTLEEKIFVISMLGDDRLVAETYALGKCVHRA